MLMVTVSNALSKCVGRLSLVAESSEELTLRRRWQMERKLILAGIGNLLTLEAPMASPMNAKEALPI
jgi:hypothetical protein